MTAWASMSSPLSLWNMTTLSVKVIAGASTSSVTRTIPKLTVVEGVGVKEGVVDGEGVIEDVGVGEDVMVGGAVSA